MTNENAAPTELPAPSDLKTDPEVSKQETWQKQFNEKAAKLSEETKKKINHTLAFLEGGMNQWEQVKSKGHKPEDFIQGFVHTLMEYDKLREGGTDVRRAQMLVLMKTRELFVDIAVHDLETQN